jgi:ATP-binding cassette subfamily F protein 3
MIVGLEKPTKGRIHMAPGVKLGFFDQEHAGLDPNRKLIEEVRSVRPKMADEEARGILGRFLFRGEDAFKTAGKLSGGEKARLALAKFLIGETNFLVLDEPTNHLDLASQDVIEKSLAEYDGTMLVVSHDRHFLDAVVTKIAVVAKRNVGLFTGNFSSTRTLTRLQEFQETGKPVEYVVRKTFKDYEKGVRYSWGTTVTVTGNETQTTKRLFKYAMERGWLEVKE